MTKRLLVTALFLSVPLCAFAQVGSHRTPIFNDESVKRNVASQTAADDRRAREAAEIIERERRAIRQVEIDFAAERKKELTRLDELPPDAPEMQMQLDYFHCMYPPLATRPPKADEVDNCLSRLREQRKRKIQEATFEQEQLERERLRAEDAQREEERRKSELAIKLAADEKERAEKKKTDLHKILYGLAYTTLGVVGVIATIYRRRTYGWRNLVLAVIFGGLSAFLIYFMCAMMVAKNADSITPSFVAITFFGGWIFSINLLIKGTVKVSKVISRGFLLGAVEWLLMLPVGFFFAGRMVAGTIADIGGESGAAVVGAALGGGLFTIVNGGFAVAMVVICLIGYAVTYFFTREMFSESNDGKKKCPECAEYVQLEARKCRYCGATLVHAAIPNISAHLPEKSQ